MTVAGPGDAGDPVQRGVRRGQSGVLGAKQPLPGRLVGRRLLLRFHLPYRRHHTHARR